MASRPCELPHRRHRMNRDERMNFQHSSAPRSNPELRLHPAYTLAVKQTSPWANKPVLRDTGYNAATHCAFALCETAPSRPKQKVRKPTCTCGLKRHRDTHIYSSLLKTEGKHTAVLEARPRKACEPHADWLHLPAWRHLFVQGG